MNLTKALKARLLSSVVNDQFKKRINEWEETAKQLLLAEALKHDNGVSQKVADLISSSKTTAKARFTNNVKNESVWMSAYDLPKVKNLFSGKIVFQLKREFNTDKSFLTFYGEGAVVEHTPEIRKHFHAGKKMVDDMNSLSKDLYAVLNSVRTVKKLKEITKVFDPFLPDEAKQSTSLIPSDAICRVNELKSPANS